MDEIENTTIEREIHHTRLLHIACSLTIFASIILLVLRLISVTSDLNYV